MACERYREAISARLDGEAEPGGAAALDAHLARCADCRQWAADAALVTRLARVQVLHPQKDLVVPFGPGRAVAAPKAVRRRPRLSRALRLALGAFGAAQFVLGMLQTVGSAAAAHDHDSALPVDPGHLWHESAAWNIAIGAGFAWIALRRCRPAGALPMLTAFVAFLTLLSINDIAAGRVDGLRLLSHGFVVAGYGIVMALCRPSLDPGLPPPGRQGPPWRWRVGLDEAGDRDADSLAPAVPPSLRLIRGEARMPRRNCGQQAA